MYTNIRIYPEQGLALFEDGETLLILDRTNSDLFRPASPHDFPMGWPLEETAVALEDGAGFQEIRQALTHEKRKQNAFFLTVSAMSPDLDEGVRQTAVKGAERRMQADDQVHRFVRGRLYAFPPPAEEHVDRGMAAAVTGQAERLHRLLQEVQAFRIEIEHFSDVWQNHCAATVGDSPALAMVYRKRLADKAVFKDLCQQEWDDTGRENLVYTQMLERLSLDEAEQQCLSLLLDHLPPPDWDPAAEDDLDDDEDDWYDDDDAYGGFERMGQGRGQGKGKAKGKGKGKAVPSAASAPKAANSNDPLDQIESVLRNWPDEPVGYVDPSKILSQIDYIQQEMAKGDLNRALHDTLHLLESQQKNSRRQDAVKTVCAIADAAAKRSRYPIAERLYQMAQVFYPKDPVPFNGLADSYRLRGAIDQAIALYKEAQHRFPDNVVAYNGLAECYRSRGSYDQAIALYEEARDRFPDAVVAYTGLAECYRGRGSYNQAIVLYEEARDRFPDDVIAYNGLAECYRGRGFYDQAIGVYEEARDRFPDDGVAYRGLAECYRGRGSYDQAIALYEEARDRFPDDVVAYTGLAECYRGRGSYDQAIGVYEEARERFPDNLVARNGLANLYVQVGQFEAARAMLSDRPPMSKEEWIGYHILAMSYWKDGDLAQAAHMFEYGLEHSAFPDVTPYYESALAATRLALGDYPAALNVLNLDAYRSPAQEEAYQVLRLHAHGALAQREAAAAVIDFVQAAKQTAVQQLGQRLSARYGLQGQPPLSEAEAAQLDRDILADELNLVLQLPFSLAA